MKILQNYHLFLLAISIILNATSVLSSDDNSKPLVPIYHLLLSSSPEPAMCDSSHLNLCASDSACTNAAGYWWSDNTCNGSPESSVPTVTSAGQIWMDRNLGASRVATSYDDAHAYGDLYQWGRGKDGHEKRTSPTTTVLSQNSDTPGHGSFILVSRNPYDWRTPQVNSLWQGVSGTNNPCPAGFRLPTYLELDAERLSWTGGNNSAGAFGSPLKLVVAGYRYHLNGKLDDAGSIGYYWSSTVNGSNARLLYFGSSYANMGNDVRAYGFSVRCLKD